MLEQPAKGRAAEFQVNSNIRLSIEETLRLRASRRGQMTPRPPSPGEVRPINWENEHDGGSFLAEQAKGRTGDKRPPDSAKRT